VLVIEDDDRIASFIVNGLKQAGFATDTAANGEDGLRRASTEHYDAAVVDLMLPKLDGLSLIEELRRQEINTPVIILRVNADSRVSLGVHYLSDVLAGTAAGVAWLAICLTGVDTTRHRRFQIKSAQSGQKT